MAPSTKWSNWQYYWPLSPSNPEETPGVFREIGVGEISSFSGVCWVNKHARKTPGVF